MPVRYWNGGRLTDACLKRATELANKAGDLLVIDITENWTPMPIGEPAPPGKAPAVRAGVLERSIRFEVALVGDSVELRVGAGVEAPYGITHEMGLPPYPARPWLLPAFERMRSKIEALFKAGFR